MTRRDVVEIGTMLLESNVDALRTAINDPNSSVLRVMLASISARAIEKSDAKAMSLLLDQIVGKPRLSISLSGKMRHAGELILRPGSYMKDPEAREAALLLAERTAEESTPFDDPTDDSPF